MITESVQDQGQGFRETRLLVNQGELSYRFQQYLNCERTAFANKILWNLLKGVAKELLAEDKEIYAGTPLSHFRSWEQEWKNLAPGVPTRAELKELKDKKVTIFGASSELGMAAVDWLIKLGAQVTVVVRNNSIPPELARLIDRGLCQVKNYGQIKETAIKNALETKQDAVLNYIGTLTTDPDEATRINVGLAKQISEAAKKNNRNCLVLNTSSQVASVGLDLGGLDKEPSPYYATKRVLSEFVLNDKDRQTDILLLPGFSNTKLFVGHDVEAQKLKENIFQDPVTPDEVAVFTIARLAQQMGQAPADRRLEIVNVPFYPSLLGAMRQIVGLKELAKLAEGAARRQLDAPFPK